MADVQPVTPDHERCSTGRVNPSKADQSIDIGGSLSLHAGRVDGCLAQPSNGPNEPRASATSWHETIGASAPFGCYPASKHALPSALSEFGPNRVSRYDHQRDPEIGADTVPNLLQPFTILHFDGSAVNQKDRSIAVLEPQQCLPKALSQLGRMSLLAEALDLDPY